MIILRQISIADFRPQRVLLFLFFFSLRISRSSSTPPPRERRAELAREHNNKKTSVADAAAGGAAFPNEIGWRRRTSLPPLLLKSIATDGSKEQPEHSSYLGADNALAALKPLCVCVFFFIPLRSVVVVFVGSGRGKWLSA